jgi:hypothetical protein
VHGAHANHRVRCSRTRSRDVTRGGRRKLVIATLSTLPWTGAACSSFEGLSLRQDSQTKCASAGVPPAPLLVVASGDTEFVVAVRAYDLGDSDDDAGANGFARMGFDLDDTCTGSNGPASCAEPPWASANHADGTDGRDNAIGALLYRLRQMNYGPATPALNGQIDSGTITTLLRVRGYNGLGTDDRLEVSLYAATRPRGPDLAASRPRWDGTDVWDVLEPWVRVTAGSDGGPVYDAMQPAFVDDHAYVNDGVLVARWDSLVVGAGDHLQGAMMQARVVPSGDAWSLENATIAGRLRIDDVLMSGTTCTDAPTYPELKRLACGVADINFEGSDKRVAPCDAASWAWQFRADPAKLGVVTTGTTPVPLCPPETSPANDHCNTLH